MTNFFKKCNKKLIICVGLFLSLFMFIFGIKVDAAAPMMTGDIYGGVIWDNSISVVQSSQYISTTQNVYGEFKTYTNYSDSNSVTTFTRVSISFGTMGEISRIKYYLDNTLVQTFYNKGTFVNNYCPFFWTYSPDSAVGSLTTLNDIFKTFVQSHQITGLDATYPGHVFGLSASNDTELIQNLQNQITELTATNTDLNDQIATLNNLVTQQNVLIESLRHQLATTSKDIYAWSTISFAVLINNPASSSGVSYYFGEFNQNGVTMEKDTLKFDVHKFFTTKEIEMPTTAFGDGSYFKVHFYSNTLYNAMNYPIYYNVKDNQFLNICNLPSGVGTTDEWPADSVLSSFSFNSSMYNNTLIYSQNVEWNGLEIGIKSLEDGYIIDLRIGNTYQKGFDNGYIAGQESCQTTINSLKSKLDELEKSNSDLLKSIEDLSNDKNSFLGLFMGIGNIPGNIMSSMLNFEILGINLLGLVTGLLSALLLIWLIKKLL